MLLYVSTVSLLTLSFRARSCGFKQMCTWFLLGTQEMYQQRTSTLGPYSLSDVAHTVATVREPPEWEPPEWEPPKWEPPEWVVDLRL